MTKIPNSECRFIKVLCFTESEKDLVKSVCIANPGDSIIRIIVGKKQEDRKSYRGMVNPTDEVINQLKNIVGESRIRIS